MFISEYQMNTIINICKMYGIERCILFGSYANGNATDKSDLDIIVNTFQHWQIFGYALQYDLIQGLGKKIDLFIAETPDKIILKEKIDLI